MLTPDILKKSSNTDIINYAKKEYNKRIVRVKKAEAYYSNPNTTEEQIERSFGTLMLILEELSSIGNEIEELTGEKINSYIAVNGFKGV